MARKREKACIIVHDSGLAPGAHGVHPRVLVVLRRQTSALERPYDAIQSPYVEERGGSKRAKGRPNWLKKEGSKRKKSLGLEESKNDPKIGKAWII